MNKNQHHAIPSDIMPHVDMNALIPSHDILWVVLDTLRYDVAQALFFAGRLPTLSQYLPPTGWQRSHTPATFTYPAHQAFFAGFLPTPAQQPKQPRLFAIQFHASETTSERTLLFHQHHSIPQGLASLGYHTLCIGGVGFFNPNAPLGRVLPSLFMESHWSDKLGVADPRSCEHQVALACERLTDPKLSTSPVFTFVNIAALHQPNYFYHPNHLLTHTPHDPNHHPKDSLETHGFALEYVDSCLAELFTTARQRRPTFVIVCSDHGTAYGDGDYEGHRLAHDCVLTVPYAHFILSDNP